MKKFFKTKKFLAVAMAAVLSCSAGLGAFVTGADTNVGQEDELPARIGDEGCLEIPNTESTFSRYNPSFLSVNGFASAGVHDRTEYIGTPYYRQVSTPAELVKALYDAQHTETKESTVKVIEIMCDMRMGYEEAGIDDIYKDVSLDTGIFSKDKMNNGVSVINPLITAAGGVSKMQISHTDGLTIFSRYGATLLRTEFDITDSSNDIVIRNIKMDGSWQWDNNETKLQKESGITYVKVNGDNVWIDHCEFTIAPDGCIDMESDAHGITYSWCKFGLDPDEAVENETIRTNILHMEELYQADLEAIENGEKSITDSNAFSSCDVNNGSRYRLMRQAGATPEEIMQYTAYHSKVHLVGAGDKDLKTNPYLRLSLGYNLYESVGQRIPMIRQGTGHLYNCVIDNTKHVALEKKFRNEYGLSSKVTGYTLTRCINARNGACIAADTCVFNAVNGAITGNECQGNDKENMKDKNKNYTIYATNFENTLNHALIVNSKVINTNGEKDEGSSWDNDGVTLFTEGSSTDPEKDKFWHDKSTLKNWAWSSTVLTSIENIYPGPFSVKYNTDEKLPYSYQLVPLEDVEDVVKTYSGMGVYDLTPEQWLRTEYNADEDIQPAGENKVNIASKVEFANKSLVAYMGEKVKFDVVATPENVTNPTYKWSVIKKNSGDAEFDEETGEFIPLAEGKVTIEVELVSVNGTSVKKTAMVTIKAATATPSPTAGADTATPSPTAGADTAAPSATAGADTPTPSAVVTDAPTTEPTITPSCNTTGPSVTTSAEPTTSAPVEVKAGDANEDGIVNLDDVMLILRAALGIEEINKDTTAFNNSDYNNDGAIGLDDCLEVLKIALGIS